MNCPNCGVYNPEDRSNCWRCHQELPKPVEVPKKKDPRARNQMIMWIAVAVFFVIMLVQMCALPRVLQQPESTPVPGGYLSPAGQGINPIG